MYIYKKLQFNDFYAEYFQLQDKLIHEHNCIWFTFKNIDKNEKNIHCNDVGRNFSFA